MQKVNQLACSWDDEKRNSENARFSGQFVCLAAIFQRSNAKNERGQFEYICDRIDDRVIVFTRFIRG